MYALLRLETSWIIILLGVGKFCPSSLSDIKHLQKLLYTSCNTCTFEMGNKSDYNSSLSWGNFAPLLSQTLSIFETHQTHHAVYALSRWETILIIILLGAGQICPSSHSDIKHLQNPSYTSCNTCTFETGNKLDHNSSRSSEKSNHFSFRLYASSKPIIHIVRYMHSF